MSSFRDERGFTLIDVMVTVAIMGIVAAAAIPMTGSSLGAFQFQGDGERLANTVKLAKMRATASFSRARVYTDLAANTYILQVWDRAANTWTIEGGVQQLSDNSAFGFGGLAAPPPNTQAAIGFSPACTSDMGNPVADTACIIFNSRGIPVDATGVPTGGNGLYVTDGVGVYGVTVTATPLVRLWWSPATTAAWSTR